jgi:hypothetical protein
MKRNLTRLLQNLAVIFSVIIPAGTAYAQTQLPPDAPLTDQLKALYKVTKFGLDGGGFTVLSPGTILVIQKGGIVGVPPANITMGVAVFKLPEIPRSQYSRTTSKPRWAASFRRSRSWFSTCWSGVLTRA